MTTADVVVIGGGCERTTRVRWLRPEEELIVFDTMPQATKPT